MRNDIFFHIGLPKTGTTFLQNSIFPALDEDKIFYKPTSFLELKQDKLANLVSSKSKVLNQKNGKKFSAGGFLFSSESLSTDGYSFHYSERLKTLSNQFPEARIILVLRFQPDWLLSLYKQSIHQMNPQSIKSFLQYDDNEGFKNLPSMSKDNWYQNKSRLPTINIFTIDYSQMITDYRTAFGKKNVCVLFYEDFKANRTEFVEEICKFLNIKTPQFSPKPVYKSLSSLSISLLISFHRLCTALNITIPYNFEETKVVQTYGFRGLMIKLLNRNFNWVGIRLFLHRYLDKALYVDTDILEKNQIRAELTEYFHVQNKKIKKLHPDIRLPEVYYKTS
jgi:hypothetical protein